MHIFYDKELAMIAQLQMTTEYYTMSHTTNKFHYNNVIHILLGQSIVLSPIQHLIKKSEQRGRDEKVQLEGTESIADLGWNQKYNQVNTHELYITKTNSEKQMSLVF